MFKISAPQLNNLINIKYNDIPKKEKLEKYIIDNENIKLDQNVEIKVCKFNGVIFDKINIKFGNIEDVEFINCDLSNISFMDTTFFRVKFTNCKLFGANFIDCNFDNIVISDCMCNLINIASLKIQNTKIVNSNLIESRIMSCNLKNIIIDNVNFTHSEIINTPLKDIDLSNSNLSGINTDLNSIKGIIINSYQAMDLIGILGVKIKN